MISALMNKETDTHITSLNLNVGRYSTKIQMLDSIHPAPIRSVEFRLYRSIELLGAVTESYHMFMNM